MPSTSLAPFPEVAPPDPAGPRPPYRLAAALGLLGAALLTAGTVLHPAHADPGSPSGAGEDRPSLFAAALAVRQIEIGLDALFALLLAAAVLAFGIGLCTAPHGSRGLRALAIVARTLFQYLFRSTPRTPIVKQDLAGRGFESF